MPHLLTSLYISLTRGTLRANARGVFLCLHISPVWVSNLFCAPFLHKVNCVEKQFYSVGMLLRTDLFLSRVCVILPKVVGDGGERKDYHQAR